MRDAYFSLAECREDEIDELRDRLYYTDPDDMPELTQEEVKTIGECLTPSDIPYELLEKVFGIYSFVEEDFFCNV